MLSYTNPICTLLQIWFCTCLSINGHVTILGFARAYVSAFTSFLSGQTVKTSALCRQVTLFKYPCSAVLCTHFREMAPLSIRHILAEEDITNLAVQGGVSTAPTTHYCMLSPKPTKQRKSHYACWCYSWYLGPMSEICSCTGPLHIIVLTIVLQKP